MNKLNRKDLKHDRFAEEVQHSLKFVGAHRSQFKLYIAIGVAVLVVAIGIYSYRNSRHAQRETALKEALKVQGSAVGASQSEFVLTYPTTEARNKAIIDKFTEVANKYPGTDEGATAQYYLGITLADLGRIDEAEKAFLAVVNKGDKNYAALGRFSLAQIYESRGKLADAERELRAIIDSPSILLSKEQATIALAKVLSRTKPDEARKLLEPYRASPRAAVSRSAIDALSNLPQPNLPLKK